MEPGSPLKPVAGPASQPPAEDHFIVAIGASAGGLESIHDFFDNMPSNGNLSFVIIQHLSPDYKSLLVELVSKHTNMEVLEAGHNMEVRRNAVYVIPNNKRLTINQNHLRLEDKQAEKAPNTAIDHFLLSLAEDAGTHAIAIILSGTGTDGTKGIRAVQQNGGLVLVQDPATAKFDGMPNSAIASGIADFILSPELMPDEIMAYIKERPVRLEAEGKPDESMLPEVLRLIERSCHYDFTHYKTPTILRRIARRMTQLGYKKFKEYLEHLRGSTEECSTLGKEFLIGVTRFFRDPAAFELLRTQVLPELVAGKGENDVIKVWVTACSTGEEAYSIAILLDQYLQHSNKNIEVKIFASDIDIDSIEQAARGVYPLHSVAELDPHLVARYFIRENNSLVVNARIRKQIVFARHNILKDPPFIKNDIVTCRNMLIYMNHLLQRKVLATLQFALNTGGFLFLGPSEIPATIREGFTEIDGKWKVFRKTTIDNRFNPDRVYGPQMAYTQRESRIVGNPKEVNTARALADDFRDLLTEEYGYAAIYIDRNLEVKEAVGDFRKYLSLPDRIMNLNLLKMVTPELAVSLNAALRKAGKEKQKVALRQLRMGREGEEKLVDLFIRPAAGRDELTLVAFGLSHGPATQKTQADHLTHTGSDASYISELEEELKETRMNLQLAVESLETTNEELQSSNEELLSANEELQSSNEELQSLNEELHTLNTEHQLRIKELIELNDDLNNYFRSSGIAQVFVDRDLRIRKFNPVAVQLINLIETDVGRPIDHISTNIPGVELLSSIQDAISGQQQVEREVVLASGSVMLMRILPYLRLDQRVDGAVITFVDITRVKELDDIIKGVFNASQSAILALRAEQDDRKEIRDFRLLAVNHAASELLYQPSEKSTGRLLSEALPELADKTLFTRLSRVINTGQPVQLEWQWKRGEDMRWYLLSASQMPAGLVISLTDITDKKKIDEKLRANYQELMRAKENYRALNQELEQKVTERTFALSQSEERFRLIANATSDAIWDWDLVNNQVWWSESFYNLFGYDRNSNTSDSSFWLDHIHPDDRARVHQQIHDAINQANPVWSSQYRFQRKDGTYARVYDRGALLADSAGIPFRMVGAMMDVTEMERAEEQLKVKNRELESLIQEFTFVTDFMPQMVWATRPDGYHDFFNKQWYIYTGLDYEQTKDKGWVLVLHPDDYERTWKAWRKCLEAGEAYESEYRLRRHDGQYRWFLARAIPLRDETGTITKWFGTCTDINDQKLATDLLEHRVRERTRELQKTNQDLETSNDELLQFASVASHDLKEPLRKIHLFSHIVRDRYLQPQDGAYEYMERVIAASSRMTKLINDLLSFTRLSVDAPFEETDLNTVLGEVLSDLELVIHEKEAQVVSDQLPVLEAVPGQIRQVIQNIVSNALKFTRPNISPEIRISAEYTNSLDASAPATSSGAFLRLRIKDNGIGFGNQYAEKIFTIFQRLHAREKYEGTGIGLAITRKIIERHHGLITAQGSEGEGATFTLVLPLRQPEVPLRVEAGQGRAAAAL